jgi:hypothetical protein
VVTWEGSLPDDGVAPAEAVGLVLVWLRIS